MRGQLPKPGVAGCDRLGISLGDCHFSPNLCSIPGLLGAEDGRAYSGKGDGIPRSISTYMVVADAHAQISLETSTRVKRPHRNLEASPAAGVDRHVA